MGMEIASANPTIICFAQSNIMQRGLYWAVNFYELIGEKIYSNTIIIIIIIYVTHKM
jgi:hypothetical protein